MKPTQEQVIAWVREAGIPDANTPLIAVGRLETGAELLQSAFALAYEAGRRDEREWQGLTDEEYESMAEKYVTNYFFDTLKYARAIEAKLREKNA